MSVDATEGSRTSSGRSTSTWCASSRAHPQGPRCWFIDKTMIRDPLAARLSEFVRGRARIEITKHNGGRSAWPSPPAE
jgi:hypothetical protein